MARPSRRRRRPALCCPAPIPPRLSTAASVIRPCDSHCNPQREECDLSGCATLQVQGGAGGMVVVMGCEGRRVRPACMHQQGMHAWTNAGDRREQGKVGAGFKWIATQRGPASASDAQVCTWGPAGWGSGEVRCRHGVPGWGEGSGEGRVDRAAAPGCGAETPRSGRGQRSGLPLPCLHTLQGPVAVAQIATAAMVWSWSSTLVVWNCTSRTGAGVCTG